MTRSLKTAQACLLALGAMGFGAGALRAQGAKPDPSVRPQPPLAPMASQHVLVLPVQMLRADSGAWVGIAGWEKFRRELDDSIGSAIAARGIGRTWKYAADVARIAKRNPDYVGDVYSMGVQSMRAVKYKIGDPIPDIFNNNLRLLIALGDARYALLPVEVWFVRRGDQQIAALKLALIDGRGGSFVWMGEVGSDPATSMTPALINSLAARVADLVAAP